MRKEDTLFIIETIGGIMAKKRKRKTTPKSKAKKSTSNRNYLTTSALNNLLGISGRKKRSVKRKSRRVRKMGGITKATLTQKAKSLALTTGGIVLGQKVKEQMIKAGMLPSAANFILIACILIPDLAKLTGSNKDLVEDLVLGMGVEGLKSILRDNDILAIGGSTYQNWLGIVDNSQPIPALPRRATDVTF